MAHERGVALHKDAWEARASRTSLSGVSGGMLAPEPATEPAAKRSTPKAMAETVMSEVPGALFTLASRIEILLTLEALRPGPVVPVQLVDVRRGNGRASTAQPTLATGTPCDSRDSQPRTPLGWSLTRYAAAPSSTSRFSIAPSRCRGVGTHGRPFRHRCCPPSPDAVAALAAGPLEAKAPGACGGAKTGNAALGGGPAAGLGDTPRSAHDVPAPVPVGGRVRRSYVTEDGSRKTS